MSDIEALQTTKACYYPILSSPRRFHTFQHARRYLHNRFQESEPVHLRNLPFKFGHFQFWPAQDRYRPARCLLLRPPQRHMFLTITVDA